jgi:hypothetical protein
LTSRQEEECVVPGDSTYRCPFVSCLDANEFYSPTVLCAGGEGCCGPDETCQPTFCCPDIAVRDLAFSLVSTIDLVQTSKLVTTQLKSAVNPGSCPLSQFPPSMAHLP